MRLNILKIYLPCRRFQKIYRSELWKKGKDPLFVIVVDLLFFIRVSVFICTISYLIKFG